MAQAPDARALGATARRDRLQRTENSLGDVQHTSLAGAPAARNPPRCLLPDELLLPDDGAGADEPRPRQPAKPAGGRTGRGAYTCSPSRLGRRRPEVAIRPVGHTVRAGGGRPAAGGPRSRAWPLRGAVR